MLREVNEVKSKISNSLSLKIKIHILIKFSFLILFRDFLCLYMRS